MVRAYPPDSRPLTEDDYTLIVSVLVDAGILTKGVGNKATDYGAGQNFVTLRQYIEAGELTPPPYSESAHIPVVDASRCNATLRNAGNTRNTTRPARKGKVTAN